MKKMQNYNLQRAVKRAACSLFLGLKSVLSLSWYSRLVKCESSFIANPLHHQTSYLPLFQVHVEPTIQPRKWLQLSVASERTWGLLCSPDLHAPPPSPPSDYQAGHKAGFRPFQLGMFLHSSCITGSTCSHCLDYSVSRQIQVFGPKCRTERFI